MFFPPLFLWISVLISTATAAAYETQYCDLNTTSHIYNTSYYSNLIQVLASLASDATVSEKRFLNKSSGSINNKCPFSKAAVFWSDTCMLRYANYSMVSILNSESFIPECNNVSISDGEQNRFWKLASNLMVRLANNAPTYPQKMFAYDELFYDVTGRNLTIYGYVQCTPDLSGPDCNKCLHVSIERLRQYCYGREGARVLAPSCNVRFEIYNFLQFPTASSDKPGKKRRSSKIIAAVVATVGFLSVTLVLCYFFIEKKRHHPIARSDFKDKTDESEMITEESLQFELGTIEEATNNFSNENKIGEGGFGVVYKIECGYDEDGWWLSDHEDGAALMKEIQQWWEGNRLESIGYMSPEYAMHGYFSVKSDVFSLGVMLLEIISGKKNTTVFQPGYTNLLCHAWSKWKNGDALGIVDSNIVDSVSEIEALRCINIALLCVQEDDELRPSMASVVLMLNSNSIPLLVPENPPFVSRREQLVSHNSICIVWPTDASLITDVHPR
ncbi:hypothetical protein L1987_03473 [Smallanthus sonchifolius]|uniref:Uncharacterized protein n=1 Tax=Smallanthus sonchifolius TaxID=185202 RepID=A0ACB9KAS0_9ASTR|nr:hypothetical protein L1987_03473 [Smallanthus sonchifolius]